MPSLTSPCSGKTLVGATHPRAWLPETRSCGLLCRVRPDGLAFSDRFDVGDDNEDDLQTRHNCDALLMSLAVKRPERSCREFLMSWWRVMGMTDHNDRRKVQNGEKRKGRRTEEENQGGDGHIYTYRWRPDRAHCLHQHHIFVHRLIHTWFTSYRGDFSRPTEAPSHPSARR